MAKVTGTPARASTGGVSSVSSLKKKAAAAKAKASMTTVNGVPVSKTQAKFLGGDSSYQNTQSGLVNQLASYQADQLNQRNQYGIDEADTLNKLGFQGAIYTPGKATKTNNAPAGTFNTSTAAWQPHDTSTAYGRDLTGQADDFAARGMAGTGAYAKAAGDVRQQYNDQVGAIVKAGTRYQGDVDSQLSAYRSQNRTDQNQALYDALARYAAAQAS